MGKYELENSNEFKVAQELEGYHNQRGVLLFYLPTF